MDEFKNDNTLPDPLTVAFPNLLRSIPENERLIEMVTFESVPGIEDIETFIIRIPNADAINPAHDMTGEIMLSEDVVDETQTDAVTEVIELDEAFAEPAIAEDERRPAGPRKPGQHRAPSSTLYALLVIGGLMLLVYGVWVQLYLSATHPLLVAISIPALVIAGAAMASGLAEKR